MGEWTTIADPAAAEPVHEHEKPHLTGNETNGSIWTCDCGTAFQLSKPTNPDVYAPTTWEELKKGAN